METERLELQLKLEFPTELHVHHHHHHSEPQPGAADILNSIQELRKDLMTELATITATESADQATLLSKTDALIAAFQNLNSANNATLQAALDAANLDSATQAGILTANDKAINDEIAKVNAALVPADPGQPMPGMLSVTASFSDCTVNTPYTGSLSISGGTAPYSVTVNDPASINGLAMDSNGAVAGTPTVAGGVSFSGTVVDNTTPSPQSSTFSGSFTVAEAVNAV